MSTKGTDNETLDVVNHLLFIILLLSLYEPSEENKKNVILYGVPGIPSLRVLAKSSYCDIRKIIRGRAPHLPNFYFVHGGVIIKDEYADIAWVRGHLVLNVNFCGEVRGGSEKGAAEGGDKERPVLEDTSDEDVFDDTEIGLVSDTESAADSDSTWDLEREKKHYRKKSKSAEENGRCSDRTR